MSEMSRPKSSMTIDGSIERIEYHFEALGVSARPTQSQYVKGWDNQMPAKKTAETFARRHTRGGDR